MATIIIKDVEFELDLLNVDTMEKYEKLNQKIVERIADESTYSGMSTAQAMRKQCSLVDEFIDELFGEGSAKKCFGDVVHLGDRLDAFGKISEASNTMNETVGKITQRYGNGRLANREQRRHQQFHGGQRKN